MLCCPARSPCRETVIIVTIAALLILVFVGGSITFSWLCGIFAGRAVQWALKVEEPTTAEEPHPNQWMLRERALELRERVEDMELDQIVEPGKYSARQLRRARAKANRADRAAMLAESGE